MESKYDSLQNLGLHRFALLGDDEGVRHSLRDGADVNAHDPAGRTAIMCAVTGENWQNVDACDASFMTKKRLNVIKMLLNHPDISLLTLNSPHPSMNGVIPLGMAAWLNQPAAVRVLLDESIESVCVDGIDSHGATALMYAARDGSLEVVQELLSHGARPDFRDRNYRTSLQFALAHPQILWLCESALRHHRWRECKSADRTRLPPNSEHLVELAHSAIPFSDNLEPPPLSIFTKESISRLTDNLISFIRSSNLSFLYSLLYPPSAHCSTSIPLLVNIADSCGWSAIHHCVAADQPSISILDALYCAGADVSLFTLQGHQTPLHILARSPHSSAFLGSSLEEFTLHLIQDLRAPLSARDKDDETCIHVAAEHGHSLGLLMLLIDCDQSGSIRELKNSRGLTAFQVARDDFLPAFGIEKRPPSALSHRTLRATDSFASLADSFYLESSNDATSIFSTADFDVHGSINQLLAHLRLTSMPIQRANKHDLIQSLETSIECTNELSNSLVQHFRSRIEDVTTAIRDLRKNVERISSVGDVVGLAASGKLIVRGISPLKIMRRQRDSEDSLTTAVSFDEEYSSTSSGIASTTQAGESDSNLISTSIQTDNLDVPWIGRFLRSRTNLLDLSEMKCEPTLTTQPQGLTTSNTSSLKLKHLLKRKKKLNDKIRDLDLDLTEKNNSPYSSRVKAWIKRMVVPQNSSPKVEIVLDLDGENCHVGHEIKNLKPPALNCGDAVGRSIDIALRTSQVVLTRARRDLLNIEESIAAAEQCMTAANHSISRMRRVAKRAVKKREATVVNLKATTDTGTKPPLTAPDEFSPELLGYTNAVTLRPSLASISTNYSTSSSILSVAETVIAENDDEETRIIRRLLLRKIEAQISGAWDEVERATSWLQIVKEAIRSVKRRAYL